MLCHLQNEEKNAWIRACGGCSHVIATGLHRKLSKLMWQPDDSKISKTGGRVVSAPEIRSDELKLLQQLGSGAFGSVYLGECRGEQVAIKKLHAKMSQNSLTEFKKEVAIFTHLRHPNVVLFMGACTEPSKLCMVTEYMPKGDVYHLIHNPHNKISLSQIILMARDCTRGMAWLHESKPPIIHCDLKPTNLLVDNYYRVKICDFGMSCFVKEYSRPGGGSPLYAAPEIFAKLPITEKVDVYAFGVVLWEMVTRKVPFPNWNVPGANPLHFEQSIIAGERPPLDNVPVPVATLIKECWQKKPKNRPTFPSLIPVLSNILVDITITDPEGNNFWKYYFAGERDIPWLPFVATFYQYLGEALPNEREKSSKFRALEALIKTDTEDKAQVVSIERFGQFLAWFGPLTRNALYCNTNFLDRMKATIMTPGFHGQISKSESEALLAAAYREGSFLIRLSATNPVESPYTISMIMPQTRAVVHQRVARAGNLLITQTPVNGQMTRIEATGGIENLAKIMSQAVGMLSPCLGSKIQSIVMLEQIQGDYVDIRS